MSYKLTMERLFNTAKQPVPTFIRDVLIDHCELNSGGCDACTTSILVPFPHIILKTKKDAIAALVKISECEKTSKLEFVEVRGFRWYHNFASNTLSSETCIINDDMALGNKVVMAVFAVEYDGKTYKFGIADREYNTYKHHGRHHMNVDVEMMLSLRTIDEHIAREKRKSLLTFIKMCKENCGIK